MFVSPSRRNMQALLPPPCHNTHINNKKPTTTDQTQDCGSAPTQLSKVTDTHGSPKPKTQTCTLAPVHPERATEAPRSLEQSTTATASPKQATPRGSKQPVNVTRSPKQATKTPRRPNHTQNRDKNLSRNQETRRNTQYIRRIKIQAQEGIPEISTSTAQKTHQR